MNNPWYELVAADMPLTQGDLLFDCPLLSWDATALEAVPEALTVSAIEGLVRAIRQDVIVITQACDLEHDKVANVVLCPHVALTAFRRAWETWMAERRHNPTEKAWKRTCEDIANGYVWNQTLLERCETAALPMETRVVEFDQVFTVPRVFIERVFAQRRMPRLRLLPPYREHLSQAFARFFMRVGLPQTVTPTW